MEHFDKFPTKVANKILGHAHDNRYMEVIMLFGNLGKTLQLNSDSVSDSDYGQLSAKMMGDGKDGKYLSCSKVMSKREIEEFFVGKCGKYIRLKQLEEASQESTKDILR